MSVKQSTQLPISMNPVKKIRVLVADDHPMVRFGIVNSLKEFADFEIVGEAKDGEEVLEMAAVLRPDIVLLDITMPKKNGFEVTQALLDMDDKIRILPLTMHESDGFIKKIVGSGAHGYLLKNTSKEELALAIRRIAGGERYYSPQVSQIIIDSATQKHRPFLVDGKETELPLTRKELEILVYIAQGMKNSAIAQKLFLSVRTVDTHRSNIMKKLKIKNTAGLVKFAFDNKLVKPNQLT